MYPFYNYVTQQQNVCPEDTYDDSCMSLQGVFQRIKTTISSFMRMHANPVLFLLCETQKELYRQNDSAHAMKV